MQPLSSEFSQLSLTMRRRSRPAASAPSEDLPPSAGAVVPSVPSAVPVAAPGPAPLEPASDAALVSVATSGLASAASGQFSLSLAPASASLPSIGPSGTFPGPFLPVLRPPGLPGVHSPYLGDGSVTINFSWVRQHHPLVVDVLASHDCLSLWLDIVPSSRPNMPQPSRLAGFRSAGSFRPLGALLSTSSSRHWCRPIRPRSFVP
jgi:hypothetical protein